MLSHQNASLFTLCWFGLQESEELFSTTVRPGQKQKYSKHDKRFYISIFFLPFYENQNSYNRALFMDPGISILTKFANFKKSHVMPEDKSLVALIQIARYREEAIATGKQISSSCMTHFIQTASNHFTKKTGIVLLAASGKTANEAQICQWNKTLEQKSHTCIRINFIESIISICYKQSVIWPHSHAKWSSTCCLIFTASLGNNFKTVFQTEINTRHSGYLCRCVGSGWDEEPSQCCALHGQLKRCFGYCWARLAQHQCSLQHSPLQQAGGG